MLTTAELERASKGGLDTPRPLIEVFPNRFPDDLYVHEIVVQEYSSVCPKTGMPDYGTIRIRYVAAGFCLELKSLKLYFYSFRDRGIFYENLINIVVKDLVAACAPHYLEVQIVMTPRGGVHSRLTKCFIGSESVAQRLESIRGALS